MTILTVVYHETQAHYNMALKSWRSIPQEVNILAVCNRRYTQEYPKYNNISYADTSRNCLSLAWNKGLRTIFKHEDVAIVSGLDSICPSKHELERLVAAAKEYGFAAATAMGIPSPNQKQTPVAHGDGSFSLFAITKECYEDVGAFNERYVPAYFEDNDYLERLWEKGIHLCA